jgi:hypothetical protein
MHPSSLRDGFHFLANLRWLAASLLLCSALPLPAQNATPFQITLNGTSLVYGTTTTASATITNSGNTSATATILAPPPLLIGGNQSFNLTLAANQSISYPLTLGACPFQTQNVTIDVGSDGAAAWGYNYYGLNNVPGNLGLVNQVAAGFTFAMALLVNGTVVEWGATSYDESLKMPVNLGPVQSIAAGYYHAVALLENGTVRCWGYNNYGQCDVPASLGPVQAIAAGYGCTLALLQNGTVRAWGDNTYGQCDIPSDLGPVTAIAAGAYHCLAIEANGTVRAWGYNVYGECNVPAGLGPVIAVAGGDYHSVALLANGTVVCWGGNFSGETNVPAGLGPVQAISAGYSLTLALLQNGTVRAWGNNNYGQCDIPPDLGPVSSISAGTLNGVVALSPDDTSDPITIAPFLAGFSLTATTVDAGALIQGRLLANGSIPGGITIPLKSSDPAAVSVPASVNFGAGQSQSNLFNILTFPVHSNTTVIISATYGAPVLQDISVIADVHPSSLTFAPPDGIAGDSLRGTVRLNKVAPGPLVVNFLSTNSSLVTVPPTLTISKGKTFGSFTATIAGSVSDTTPVSIESYVNGSFHDFLNPLVGIVTVEPLFNDSIIDQRQSQGSSYADIEISLVHSQASSFDVVLTPDATSSLTNGGSSASGQIVFRAHTISTTFRLWRTNPSATASSVVVSGNGLTSTVTVTW